MGMLQKLLQTQIGHIDGPGKCLCVARAACEDQEVVQTQCSTDKEPASRTARS